MKKYKNRNNNSGINYYEIGINNITVVFSTNTSYLYTYTSTGKRHVENMKYLAEQGQGLNNYINKHVKNKYSKKIY